MISRCHALIIEIYLSDPWSKTPYLVQSSIFVSMQILSFYHNVTNTLIVSSPRQNETLTMQIIDDHGTFATVHVNCVALYFNLIQDHNIIITKITSKWTIYSPETLNCCVSLDIDSRRMYLLIYWIWCCLFFYRKHRQLSRLVSKLTSSGIEL